MNEQKPFGQRVAKWSDDRKLTSNSNPSKQMKKLLEEVGELAGAIACDAPDEFMDAVGDVAVVLAVMCRQNGVDFELCLDSAWDEIKDRKGYLNDDGVFVKEVE